MNSLSLDWLVSNLRWVWLFSAAAFVIAESAIGGLSSNFSLLVVTVALGFALNGLYAGLLWAKFFPNWLGVTAAVLDAVLAIALFVMLDEHVELLLPIMLFPVVMAGVRWNSQAGILMALPIILSYGIPLLPILQDSNSQSELINTLLNLSITAITLLVAGALPGPFIRQRVEIAEQANKTELERLRLAYERGKLISEMALTVSSTLDYRKVLRTMIDLAFEAMTKVGGNTGELAIGMVLLFEEDEDESGRLTVVVGRNISRTDEGRKIRSDTGLIGRTIQTAEATITHNLQQDKVLTSFASTPGFRSAVCAPLRAGYSTYGVVLFCSREPNFYNQDHKLLLTTFCSQAIIALQNAQLFEDIKYEQQKILEKETEARHKLARDLHDGPTQSIAAIAMRLNFIKMVIQNRDLEKAYDEVVKVEEIAQRTTTEIRTMLFAMRPVILETQGLAPALTGYAERLNANESFRVTVINRGYDGQLDAEAESTVFAIVEEAVGNAKKHSQASEIRISLVARPDSLLVEVRDNGVGFDVEATKSTYDQRSSLGLINLDERAKLVGGHCIIDSASGKGTAVRIEVPFEKVEVA